ncbi:uncharacterized protein AB9X84_009302 isoform 3-T3 [Acanthopagrus schlegelii]
MEEKVNGNVASWTYRQEKHQANGKKRVFAGVPVAYVVAGTLHFREMGRIVTSELKLQRDLLSCFRVANSFLSHRTIFTVLPPLRSHQSNEFPAKFLYCCQWVHGGIVA